MNSEKQRQMKITASPSLLLLSRLNFTPSFPTPLPPPPQVVQRMGNRGCGQSITDAPASSHIFPARMVLPWAAVLQDKLASAWGLHRLQGGYLLHHGLQGNLCCSAWTTSPHSIFSHLGACKAVLPLVFSPFLNTFSPRPHHLS